MKIKVLGAATAAALALVPVAQAATVETVATGLNNPRGVAIGPDGAVYVANAGKGGKLCQGKGENRFCIGMTSSIVKVANGKKTTFIKGSALDGGRGRRIRHRRARRLRGAGREGVRRRDLGDAEGRSAARRRGRASRPAACST